ncbi:MULTISPECIES: DUF2399 domain-containing protein [unclassified Saccharothrix]|uniref:DUF2399 domain-containing protein n=1 Tax=unclassified Saccharothrix TaxID=2593673 RepID=UPI00307EEA13
MRGDAHALDDGQVTAAVVLRAVAAARRDLWSAVGGSPDAVSGALSTWAARPPGDDPWSVMMRARADLGLVTHVTAQEWRAGANRPWVVAGQEVFACENPQVLQAAARAGTSMPLLCTSGNPVTVALHALDRLIADGATVRYHGDFDVAGIQIAKRLFDRGVRPWRYAGGDYLDAVVSARLPLGGPVPDTPWSLGLAEVLAAWGSRRLTGPDDGEVTRFLEHGRETAVVRRSSNGGNGAALHAYYALGAVFRYGVDHELIGVRQNVMDRVSKPDEADSKRHGLSPQLVAEILTAARSTGNDRALDALILRFHLETACRTGGALALRRRDLGLDQCLVRLRENGFTQRWQPVSPTLMEYLDHHAREQGARDEDSRVLRFSNGDPLTKKRYETLGNRVGKHVESVRVLGITAHWLRQHGRTVHHHATAAR